MAKTPKPRRKADALVIPDTLEIPDFLLVGKRKPLTRAQQARVDAMFQNPTHADDSRGVTPGVRAGLKAQKAAKKAEQAAAREAEMSARRAAQEAATKASRPRVKLEDEPQPELRKPPKPGSRKRQVYDALVKSGRPAAIKLAKKLELSEGTAKSWFGAWARQAQAEEHNAPPTRAKKAGKSAPAAMRPDARPRKDGKRRVYLISDPAGNYGTVISAGSEQSEVRWDNGNVNTVINSWVADVPAAEKGVR